MCWVNSFIVCWAVTYFDTAYCDTTIPAKHDLVKFEVSVSLKSGEALFMPTKQRPPVGGRMCHLVAFALLPCCWV